MTPAEMTDAELEAHMRRTVSALNEENPHYPGLWHEVFRRWVKLRQACAAEDEMNERLDRLQNSGAPK